jgi:hypothetical protein
MGPPPKRKEKIKPWLVKRLIAKRLYFVETVIADWFRMTAVEG